MSLTGEACDLKIRQYWKSSVSIDFCIILSKIVMETDFESCFRNGRSEQNSYCEWFSKLKCEELLTFIHATGMVEQECVAQKLCESPSQRSPRVGSVRRCAAKTTEGMAQWGLFIYQEGTFCFACVEICDQKLNFALHPTHIRHSYISETQVKNSNGWSLTSQC